MTRLQRHLIELATRDRAVAQWVEHVQGARGTPEPIALRSLEGSAVALALIAVAEITRRSIVIVAPSNEAAEEMHDDLQHFGWPRLGVFPAWEILPYEREEPVLEITAKRLDAYAMWLTDQAVDRDGLGVPTPGPSRSIVVVTADALMQRVPPPDRLSSRRLVIRWGEPLDPERLARDLVESGYTRLPLVESRGEFSVRGNIIDIFPPTSPLPIRLDLWGEEIESIRFFDPVTQRSRSDQPEAEQIVLEPAHETTLMHGGGLVPLSDWFPSDALIHFHRADRMGEHAQQFAELIERQFNDAMRRALREEWDPEDRPPAPDELYLTRWRQVVDRLGDHPISIHTTLPTPWCVPPRDITFTTTAFESIKPDLDTYIESIRTRRREGALVVIACDNNGQVMRLVELLRAADLDT
ncbi:hypothetical protein JXA47_01310, partial [Candidatus Sumerlaeota bacterium]|nr:hypothetical protein [Candidatus Sumerlaeota bacterium]